ncbi:hypothetical protein Golob_011656, partial [Gossypium lobatum]|nr:hypothetical protein [Gossypium lobatum]
MQFRVEAWGILRFLGNDQNLLWLFTWERGNFMENNIRQWLDRGVAKPDNSVGFVPQHLAMLCHDLHVWATDLCGVRVEDGAFVPGRLITGNILLVYEIFNVYLWKKIGQKGNFTLKFDMISYSVVLNGGKVGRWFSLGKRLQQGDPLSSYLFFICCVGLSSFMRLALRDNLVRGATISKGSSDFILVIQVLIYKVKSYLLDLDAVQEKLPGHLIRVEHWRPPEDCCLKIYFNAMYHVHSQASCAGIVIRDNQGIVLGSKTNMNMHIPSPFVAVALACLQAITLGLDLGFRYVIIEGDSPTLIQK